MEASLVTKIGRAIVVWATMVIMASVSAAYAGIAFLYLTPPNPVKAQHLRTLNAIMYPLLSQNWHLFAPNPIRSNFVLTFRCRVGDTVTAWHDATAPMLSRHHRDRNSPMGRLLRPQNTAMHQVVGLTADEWLPLICRRDPNVPFCRGADEVTRRQRQTGLFVISRVASAGCDSLVGSQRASAVQARILIHQPPPWSRRHLTSEAGTTRYLPLPWDAYQFWRR